MLEGIVFTDRSAYGRYPTLPSICWVLDEICSGSVSCSPEARIWRISLAYRRVEIAIHSATRQITVSIRHIRDELENACANRASRTAFLAVNLEGSEVALLPAVNLVHMAP